MTGTGTTYAIRALLRAELDQIAERQKAIYAVIRGLDAVCQHPDQTPAGDRTFKRCNECQELVPDEEYLAQVEELTLSMLKEKLAANWDGE